MKIVDIFSDEEFIKGCAFFSIGRRFTSDCNAIGGATLEEQIIKNFNHLHENYKILNMPAIKLAIDSGDYTIDYGLFALDLLDLEEKVKMEEGLLSAADFFLFKKDKYSLALVDAASLKTSIPSDPLKDKQTPCFIHNDASGQIYEWTKNRVYGKNIGNILMMALRGEECRVYHFDGNLDKLLEGHQIKKRSKHEDFYITYKGNTKFDNIWVLFVTNRNAKTGNKPTSFRRGLKITCRKTKQFDFFDTFEMFEENSTMKRLCSFKVEMQKIKTKTLNEFGL